ncbi:hypothetical protein MUO65_01825 [bacterium]|nr:hypothetical protein [bacterium]
MKWNWIFVGLFVVVFAVIIISYKQLPVQFMNKKSTSDVFSDYQRKPTTSTEISKEEIPTSEVVEWLSDEQKKIKESLNKEKTRIVYYNADNDFASIEFKLLNNNKFFIDYCWDSWETGRMGYCYYYGDWSADNNGNYILTFENITPERLKEMFKWGPRILSDNTIYLDKDLNRFYLAGTLCEKYEKYILKRRYLL